MNISLTLNIYLLEKGVSPQREIDLSGYGVAFNVPTSPSASAPLFFKMSGSEPEWLKSLKALAGSNGDIGRSSSPQALLFVRIKQRWFVITFGHAWQKLSSVRVVSDFGTRCVLNVAKKDSLRSIRRDRIADSSIQAIEQIPDADDIHRFGMDVERDMLRGVKADVDLGYGFGPVVVGGDSFKAAIDFSKDTLESFCRRALRIYGMKKLSENFEWFGKIEPVTKESEIKNLEERLIKALSLGVKSITLSIPEFLAWDEYDIFSYKKTKRGHYPVSEPLDAMHWRAAHAGKRVTGKEIGGSYVFAYKSGQLHLVAKWPLRKCINATIRYLKETYITQLGKWYKVDTNYVNKISNQVAKIPVDNLIFPKLNPAAENEGDYNLRVSQRFASRFYYLDKQLVHVVDKSSIEVCDLLRFDGALICVKPWGGRSQHLSHLFQQVIVSGQLIAGHPPYVHGVSAQITAPGFNAIWNREAAKRSGAKFVLAIIRGVPKERLPFFAQVALVGCVQTMTQMRFDVSYATVQ